MQEKLGLNERIADHVRRKSKWTHHNRIGYAYDVFAQINTHLFDDGLPNPLIGFDSSGRLKKAGTYKYTADNIGLSYHFDLRDDLKDLELVVALIHNAVHMHTETYKENASWYHSNEFKRMMKTYGLKVSNDGDVEEIEMPVFSKVLSSIGQDSVLNELSEDIAWEEATISKDEVAEDIDPVIPGTVSANNTSLGKKKVATKTKMMKWSCGCTNVRCAKSLEATCDKCMQTFEEV